MKKYKEALLALFGLLLCAIVGLSLDSCAHRSGQSQEQRDSLTAQYAAQEDDWSSPEFYVKTHKAWKEKQKDDSIISSIPEETLLTIAKVVAKTHPTFTDKDIVAEYNSHKSIYTEVAKQLPPKYERLVETQPDSTSYDTVLNGVKVHVTEYTSLE